MMAVCVSFFFLSLCSVSGSHSQHLFAQYEFISINTIILWMRFWCTKFIRVGATTTTDGNSDGINDANVDGNGDFDAKCTNTQRNGILSFTHSLEICHIFFCILLVWCYQPNRTEPKWSSTYIFCGVWAGMATWVAQLDTYIMPYDTVWVVWSPIVIACTHCLPSTVLPRCCALFSLRSISSSLTPALSLCWLGTVF